MRRLVCAAAVAGLIGTLALPVPAWAQADTRTRPFVQGGTAYLDLSAGEYEITASPDDVIRVTSRNRGRDDVDLIVTAKGSRADVEVDGPSGDGVEVEIQLPRRTNVVIRLSAGELSIYGIEGSKDVSARAGEVRIGVGDANQYRQVNASVRIGELAARAFNVEKGGFFRSFEWTGKGKYDLKAHLTVGELRLDDEP